MWLLVLLVVSAAAAQDSVEGRLKLCGRELARTLALYCYGLDPTPEESTHTTIKLPVFDSNDVDHPKMPDRFTHRLRRADAADRVQLASLAEACCHNPCHLNELLKNC